MRPACHGRPLPSSPAARARGATPTLRDPARAQAMKTKQEKGNCPKCGGTGRVSWFFNLGFAKAFKPCVACNGTGDKDWMDKE
eukprot:tig00020723_g13474.t1